MSVSSDCSKSIPLAVAFTALPVYVLVCIIFTVPCAVGTVWFSLDLLRCTEKKCPADGKKTYRQTCARNEDTNQSDQSLCCQHEETLHTLLSKMRIVKTYQTARMRRLI